MDYTLTNLMGLENISHLNGLNLSVYR